MIVLGWFALGVFVLYVVPWCCVKIRDAWRDVGGPLP